MKFVSPMAMFLFSVFLMFAVLSNISAHRGPGAHAQDEVDVLPVGEQPLVEAPDRVERLAVEAQEQERQKFKEINRDYTKANLDSILYYAIFFPVVEIIAALALGIMVWWGARNVVGGSVTMGELIAFLSAKLLTVKFAELISFNQRLRPISVCTYPCSLQKLIVSFISLTNHYF